MVAQIPNFERAVISCLQENTMGYVQPMVFCQNRPKLTVILRYHFNELIVSCQDQLNSSYGRLKIELI